MKKPSCRRWFHIVEKRCDKKRAFLIIVLFINPKLENSLDKLETWWLFFLWTLLTNTVKPLHTDTFWSFHKKETCVSRTLKIPDVTFARKHCCLAIRLLIYKKLFYRLGAQSKTELRGELNTSQEYEILLKSEHKKLKRRLYIIVREVWM